MSAELQLTLRRPETVHFLTDAQLEWLRESLRGDPGYTLAEILADIVNERAQLWSIGQHPGYTQALVVTRLAFYPSKTALEIHLCGGAGMDRWLHLLGELEQHARNLGCDFMQLCGRRGWERALPEYRFRGVALTKELR